MKLVTYNINGIRAALRKGIVEWIEENPADIICFQEVKATPDQIDLEDFKKLGYQVYWKAAEKKGYSGVATLTKQTPLNVNTESGLTAYDSEGRILETEFADFILLNIYFPSGSSGDHRQAIKMDFLRDILPYLKNLEKKSGKGLIVGGDFNICHRAVDIHDPVRNAKSSGFLPEERAWMDTFFDNGFTDAFRYCNPEEKDAYSWWSYRANARNNNKGWRIDYWTVSNALKNKIKSCKMLSDVKHSDHCPVHMQLDF
ncbi:MAG: exodeoxyribonuclease III [Chitinophagaceae bacterium]|nr:MAG: exodeoxyribonuclease III [Chitinophagaceae bacterium]